MLERAKGSEQVSWEEVEESAKLAFCVGIEQPELIWAKEQWGRLRQSTLTTHQDQFSYYVVFFRLLVLAGIYRDFCDAAWEEYSDLDYSAWAEPFELDPFKLGQLYARLPTWEVNEEIAEEEALEQLVEHERVAVVQALISSFGGVSNFYASLWNSRD